MKIFLWFVALLGMGIPLAVTLWPALFPIDRPGFMGDMWMLLGVGTASAILAIAIGAWEKLTK